MAGGPSTIIANSTLILAGKVTKSMEKEVERTFTVQIEHLLRGDYQKEELVLTEKKNPVYGWVHIRHLPEINTGLLLFLCAEDNGCPYFPFDMNCMALLEGQEVTGLSGGSNVGINDEHWETEDYVREYNAFLNSAGPAETQANAINAVAGEENAALFHHDAANSKDSFEVNDKVSTKNGSSIGIIGGADGPTAIHVSGNPLKALLVSAIVLAVIFFAAGFGVGYIVKGKQMK